MSFTDLGKMCMVILQVTTISVFGVIGWAIKFEE